MSELPIQRAVLAERFYVPFTQELKAKANKLYKFKIYDEKACDKCEYRPDRHTDICEDCPAYLKEVKSWNLLERKDGSEWIGVPKGNRRKLKQLVGDVRLKLADRQGHAKMRTPLEFTGKLQPHQLKPVAAACKIGRGVLKAPPRAGKTVMSAAIACRMGLKTLIIASQQEWLDEFYRTFCGNAGNAAMTNATDIEKFEGRKIVGHCKTVEDFKKFDVCLCTYQTFLSTGGKAKLRKIKSLFGLIIYDEVHGVGAEGYTRVALGLNAKHVIGLTGTPARKDGSYRFVEDVIGPVTVEAHVETLIPTVRIIPTAAGTKHNYKLWVYAMRYLAKNEERNALIVKHAVKCIKAGRSLVIPVGLVDHANELTDAINKAMGKKVAVAFVSKGLTKARRAEILEGARSYKIKCIVGIRSLVQTGINVPRWDTLFVVTPISNVPKFTQETSRIRTVVDGKKPPLILHFMESPFAPSTGCFRTCYFQTYIKDRFHISEDTKKLAAAYLSTKRPSLNSSFAIV